MEYLSLYYKWMEREQFPFMCQYFIESDMWGNRKVDPLFALLMPSAEEIKTGIVEGYGDTAWGVKKTDMSFTPSPLRQNILLFMAAMNGEL